MAEKLDLSTPISGPSVTDYRVDMLRLRWGAKEIVVILKGPNGEERQERYEGTEAVALMTSLNTANLAVKSLHRRLLERLVADGKLPPGAVSGSPE